MWHRRALLPTLVLTTVALAAAAQGSGVRIETVRGVDTRIPIAVPPFGVAQTGLENVASELAQAIAYDLEFSGLFVLLRADQYPPGVVRLDPDVSKLNLEAWRTTKAEHLVFGSIHVAGTQLVCQFRLFDLFSKNQVVGQQLSVAQDRPRLAAHRFSEEILRYLDGVAGIGTTEICFSAGETGSKEIYVSDYDGANLQQVTRHNSVSIKPKVSPDGSKVAYLSYKDRYSFLYIFDRNTGKSTPLSKEVGLNSAPAWAPDGRRLAMTLSKDGNTEIYLRDADGRNPVRLTRNKDGDTQPVFSPDGRQLVFVSDRGGAAQIYVMNVDGSDQRRLSYQGGSAYDPAWSPDGLYLAYVVEKRGDGLEIYVTNADGRNPRRLTNSQGSNESPSWSRDSRHVIFMSTRTGVAQLWTVTLETNQERRVPRLSLRCEGPSWGPRRR